MNKNTLTLIVTTILGSGTRLVSTIILTRILMPEAFSLVGILGSFVFVLQMVTDVGFRSFILKHEKGADKDFLNHIWTIKFIRGIILFFIFLLLATPLSKTFDIDGLYTGILIISPLFLISSLTSLYGYVEARSNRPSKPMIIEAVSGFIGSITIIVTTIIFESKWCLVVGLLYAPTIQTVALYLAISQPMPTFRFNKGIYLEFWNWSKFIIPSSILTIAITQTDKLLLGKLFTAELLGLYYIALNLAGIFDTFVTAFSRKVLAPALASLKHSNNQIQKETYYSYKNNTLLLISFILGLVTGFAELIVHITYDERYSQVAFFLSILMIKPLLSILSFPNESVITIKGNIKATFIGNIFRLGTILISIYPLYYLFSNIGVILTFAGASTATVLYYYFINHKNGLLSIPKEASYIAVYFIALILSNFLEPTFISWYDDLLEVLRALL